MISKISMYYRIMHFFTVGEMSSLSILEGLYKSKSQNSVQLQFFMALFDQDVARNNGLLNHQQMKTGAKLHNDEMMRNWNFRIRNEVVERGSVAESPKGNKACGEMKVRECFQWKAHGQCSTGDSCSFSHDPLASGKKGEGQRRKVRSSSPAFMRRQNILTVRNTNPHSDQAINRKLERQEWNFMPIL